MYTLVDYVQKWSQRQPEKLVIFKNKEITYKELFDEISDFSKSFSFSKESVVSLLFENGYEFIIAFLGTMYAGHIPHIIPSNISNENLNLQLRAASSKVFVISSTCKNKFGKNIVKKPITFSEIKSSSNYLNIKKRSEIAYLLYTSGTTSNPKGVGVSHKSSIFTLSNIVKILKYNKNDINVLPLPLFHSFGLGCLNTSLFTGATLVLHENSNDLKKISRSMNVYKASTLAAVPSTLSKIMSVFNNSELIFLSNLRLICTNSTPISPNIVKFYQKLLSNGHLATYYGLTEASRSTFMIFDSEGRETSVGKPAPQIKIRIKKFLNNNKKGEIWINGPNVIKNYWNGEIDKNSFQKGWFRTGDIGYFDDCGFLYLIGRVDNAINVGEKVFAEEVEGMIKKIPGIEEVVVKGVSHSQLGNVIKAFIEKRESHVVTKTQIIAYCIRNLERFKVPLEIEFVKYFPKNEYGKIKRFMLE